MINLACRRPIASLALVLTAAACTSMPPSNTGAKAPIAAFSPESFFAGKTAGVGTVRIAGAGSRSLHVLATGRIETDGALLLDQLIDEEGKPPAQREWRIRQVSPRHYAGTLTDAAGPVTGELVGNSLRLKFQTTGGLDADQRLTFRPADNRVVDRMTVRKAGHVVAVFIDTIRRVG